MTVSRIAVFSAPYGLAAFVYLGPRILRIGESGSEVSHVLTNYHYGLFDTIRVFFKVFGFYVKKIVLPLPLNFTITQASDHYVWLGLVAFGVGFLLLRYKNRFVDIILCSWMMILPAIIIALVNVTWTPLAERYVYFSSALFVVGVTGGLALQLRSSVPSRLLVICCVILFLFPAATVTAHRNLTWQDNLKLYADGLKKNKGFAANYNEYAIALMDEGKLEDAEKILTEGKEKFGHSVPLLYVNHARLYLMQKNDLAAYEVLLPLVKDKQTVNLEVLKMFVKVIEVRLMDSVKPEDFSEELESSYQTLAARTGDSIFYYRLGQLQLHGGDRTAAAHSFRTAFDTAPDTAYFKEAAGKLAAKLVIGNAEILP